MANQNEPTFFARIPTFASAYKPQVEEVKQLRSFTNVGGTGDCGFRSFAVGIFSNIMRNPARENQGIAKFLIDLHATYFPQPQVQGRLMTPVDHFRKLIEAPFNRAKFALELSYALRQRTVDELCAHPEKYRGAFVDQSEGTDPQTMRQPSTYIDESAIAALSTITGVPVTVQVVEPGKEFPLSLTYTPEKIRGGSVTMQLQGKHYLPQISNPEDFALLNPNNAHQIVPSKPFNHVDNDPPFSEILQKIEEADNAMLKEFETVSNRLQLMISNKELTKDDLLRIYIEGMKKSDYLEGRIKQVGIENGNQEFFKDAIERASKGVDAVKLPQGNYDDQITQELVHAIARAISVGQLDHSVYENVETSSYYLSSLYGG